MNIVLFDDPIYRDQLLPLTYTRPVGEFRIGILKISEKWKHYFPESRVSFLTQVHLQHKYPLDIASDNVLINGAVLPSLEMVALISELKTNEILSFEGTVVAARGNQAFINSLEDAKTTLELKEASILRHPWDVFLLNRQEIEKDFELLTAGRVSEPINDPYTKVYHPERVFLEKGAVVKAAIINATDGPVYIGKNAVVSEGSFINGAFALCDHAVVNPCSQMRGDTTVGPYSKVGGEVSNTVIFGYSNKGHGGFIGNSVLGEWCNLGAGTNSSNLKNNYSKVSVWDYSKSDLIESEQQFCGLIMGDHSKSGIGSMFNTGTVVGVSANIFGSDFPPKFIPSFSWGGAKGFVPYKMHKAVEVAKAMMGRRKVDFGDSDADIFKYIEGESLKYKKES